MANFKDRALAEKVRKFRSEFNTHPELIQYGQFYLTNRIIDDAEALIKSTLESDPWWALSTQAREAAMVQVRAFFNLPIAKMTDAALRSVISALPPVIGHILLPTPGALAQIQQLYATVWNKPDIGTTPWLGGSPTLDKIRAASAFEKDKCYPVLQSLAGKLLKSRSVTSIPAASKISEAQFAGASLQGQAAGSSNPVPQQTVRFNNPAALGPLYNKMKAALDTRAVIRLGLLSGASHENSQFPTPEHYVLVFAHGLMEGQLVFLCWDPDSFVSNIVDTRADPMNETTGWGRGITCLFALSDRLSTGTNAADLVGGVQLTKGIGFGDHGVFKQRHAYQAYHIQTLPM